MIDAAELVRVFGSLSDGCVGEPAHETVVNHDLRVGMRHDLEKTLELLQQQLRVSQEREERLLTMLEQEQQARRALERRLLPPGMDDAVQRPLNTISEATVVGSGEKKKSFWEKLGLK